MAATIEAVERGEAAADQAFVAFLAALYLEGLEHMNAAGDVLHRSFESALRVLQDDGSARSLFRRYRASPTSGRFDAFDKAIIRAEQYGLVQFPNPSYTRVRVALSPADARALLEAAGDNRDAILRAAAEFRRVYEDLSW